jgi:hypothetical protein
MKRPKPVSTSTPEAGRRPMRLVDKARKLPLGAPTDLEAPTSSGAPAILVAPDSLGASADLGAALVTNRPKGWQFLIGILFLEHVILGCVTDPISFRPDISPVSFLEIRSALLSFMSGFRIRIRLYPL